MNDVFNVDRTHQPPRLLHHRRRHQTALAKQEGNVFLIHFRWYTQDIGIDNL
ncbi:MAG: hypothetical protein VX079_06880 [Pseudomonadota bacterium]|nr:hypothetical protein [Pseudomonadota bacterium]